MPDHDGYENCKNSNKCELGIKKNEANWLYYGINPNHMDKPGLVKDDPWLEPYESVIRSRMERAAEKEKELKNEYGSLKEFASGHP